LELFITGSLRGLIPDGHVLVKIDRVLDLSWLRAEVAGLYYADNGRPGIDPDVAVRLMLGIRHGPSDNGDGNVVQSSAASGLQATHCGR
jgi:hypothetical protein